MPNGKSKDYKLIYTIMLRMRSKLPEDFTRYPMIWWTLMGTMWDLKTPAFLSYQAIALINVGLPPSVPD